MTKPWLVQAHLTQVQAEKEDIAARLYGAENVRDFLMEKLKELEDTLSSTMDNSMRKDEQAAMDREIIGFLDAKTQEYELALSDFAQQNATLRTDMERLRDEHGSKIRVRVEELAVLCDCGDLTA